MRAEFFHHKDVCTRCFAYIGLFVFLAHALFRANLKAQLNSWYGRFYELAGSASVEVSSGELPSKRHETFELLVEFAVIVIPVVVVSPAARWVLSVWQFTWRMALVRSYLRAWCVGCVHIEGAAQRVHEDTKRFEEGISGCIAKVLDAVFTLLVFAPLLIDLGAQVRPPGVEWSPWLLSIAVASAVGGLAISVLVGFQLVRLEVQNQRIEAVLRTDLVLLTESHRIVCGPNLRAGDGEAIAHLPESDGFTSVDANQPTMAAVSPSTAFIPVLGALWVNYKRLYSQFALMNIWLSSFDQFNAILPFILTAPLLFAADGERRITLGLLVKITNAFGRVFDSLTVISENWTEVNAFRAVVRRLHEFEAVVYSGDLIPATTTRSDVELSSVWCGDIESVPSCTGSI